MWLTVLAQLHIEASAAEPTAADRGLQKLNETVDSPVVEWLQQALSMVAVQAETWPYRPVARAALAALDATLASSCSSRTTLG